MTSNEQKIIKSLWEAKGRARIQHLAGACGISSDYVRLICRSLARAGYIEFAGSSECSLLQKGASQFENAFLEEVLEEPIILAANVALVADTEKDTSAPASEEDLKTQPVNDDALDQGLADLTPSPKNAEEEYPKEEPSKIDGNADRAAVHTDDVSEEKVEEKKEEEIVSASGEEKAEVIDETMKPEAEAKAEIQRASADADAEAIPPAIEENSIGKKDQTESENAPAAAASSLELPEDSEKDKEGIIQAGHKSTEDLVRASAAKFIQGLGGSFKKTADWINQAFRR